MLEEKDIELLEKMFHNSENLVLDEMERTREILEGKIDEVTSLLLQMIADLRKDVDELKKKTA